MKSCTKQTLTMKIFYIITFFLFYKISFAQWPNSFDKRLAIEQSNSSYQIAGTEYDEQGNTYVTIKPNGYTSKWDPYTDSYLRFRFQKLDKVGKTLWNLDSTTIICNSYKSVPEKEGGMYIVYVKYRNLKGDPMFNVILNCAYIDKYGLKKWDSEIENYDEFRYKTSPLSINVNEQGEVVLYFITNNYLYSQKLDREGKKLLTENKKISEGTIGISDRIFAYKKGFAYSKNKVTTIYENPVHLINKRDKEWNDVWKKEVAIEVRAINSIFLDNNNNTFVLGHGIGTTLDLSKINSKGDITILSKNVIEKDFSSLIDYYYSFDSAENLHLYLLISTDNGQAKVVYNKISEQGEKLFYKELENINSRIAESINTGPPNVYREKLYDFSLNNRGDILLSWMKKKGDLTELYLSRFDSEGNLLWDEDKLIDTDSTIISTTNIPPTDSTYAVFYLTGKFQDPNRNLPMHSSNFYIKKLSKNGNYNELNAKIADKACENGKLELNLKLEGTYENNNQFRVLLSDANGSFANAKEIGTSSQTEFSIDNLKEKEGDYQVKVVSTNPAVEIAMPMALKIQKAPSFTLQYNETVRKFDSTAIRFYITGTPPYTMKLWDDTEAHISTNFFEKYVKPIATSEYTIKSFSDANCAATPVNFKITVLEPLSIEWQSRDNMRVYPIPASTKLTVEINNTAIENTPLSLYTISGELIYQKQTTNGTIDLKDISQGVYLLRGNINGKVFTRKILIEK